jgi:hypothetical protein
MLVKASMHRCYIEAPLSDVFAPHSERPTVESGVRAGVYASDMNS